MAAPLSPGRLGPGLIQGETRRLQKSCAPSCADVSPRETSCGAQTQSVSRRARGSGAQHTPGRPAGPSEPGSVSPGRPQSPQTASNVPAVRGTAAAGHSSLWDALATITSLDSSALNAPGLWDTAREETRGRALAIPRGSGPWARWGAVGPGGAGERSPGDGRWKGPRPEGLAGAGQRTGGGWGACPEGRERPQGSPRGEELWPFLPC